MVKTIKEDRATTTRGRMNENKEDERDELENYPDFTRMQKELSLKDLKSMAMMYNLQASMYNDEAAKKKSKGRKKERVETISPSSFKTKKALSSALCRVLPREKLCSVMKCEKYKQCKRSLDGLYDCKGHEDAKGEPNSKSLVYKKPQGHQIQLGGRNDGKGPTGSVGGVGGGKGGNGAIRGIRGSYLREDSTVSGKLAQILSNPMVAQHLPDAFFNLQGKLLSIELLQLLDSESTEPEWLLKMCKLRGGCLDCDKKLTKQRVLQNVRSLLTQDIVMNKDLRDEEDRYEEDTYKKGR